MVDFWHATGKRLLPPVLNILITSESQQQYRMEGNGYGRGFFFLNYTSFTKTKNYLVFKQGQATKIASNQKVDSSADLQCKSLWFLSAANLCSV